MLAKWQIIFHVNATDLKRTESCIVKLMLISNCWNNYINWFLGHLKNYLVGPGLIQLARPWFKNPKIKHVRCVLQRINSAVPFSCTHFSVQFSSLIITNAKAWKDGIKQCKEIKIAFLFVGGIRCSVIWPLTFACYLAWMKTVWGKLNLKFTLRLCKQWRIFSSKGSFGYLNMFLTPC